MSPQPEKERRPGMEPGLASLKLYNFCLALAGFALGRPGRTKTIGPTTGETGLARDGRTLKRNIGRTDRYFLRFHSAQHHLHCPGIEVCYGAFA